MFPYQKESQVKILCFLWALKIGEISRGHFCMDPSICCRFLFYLPLFVGMVMYDELKTQKKNYNEVKFEPETKLNHLSHASRVAARIRLENVRLPGIRSPLPPQSLHCVWICCTIPGPIWWILIYIPLPWQVLHVTTEPWKLEKGRCNVTYRKILKIRPRTYIFQRPFLRRLFLEGLIFGGTYLEADRHPSS